MPGDRNAHLFVPLPYLTLAREGPLLYSAGQVTLQSRLPPISTGRIRTRAGRMAPDY